VPCIYSRRVSLGFYTGGHPALLAECITLVRVAPQRRSRAEFDFNVALKTSPDKGRHLDAEGQSDPGRKMLGRTCGCRSGPDHSRPDRVRHPAGVAGPRNSTSRTRPIRSSWVALVFASHEEGQCALGLARPGRQRSHSERLGLQPEPASHRSTGGGECEFVTADVTVSVTWDGHSGIVRSRFHDASASDEFCDASRTSSASRHRTGVVPIGLEITQPSSVETQDGPRSREGARPAGELR
jgi:hypothetical protein